MPSIPDQPLDWQAHEYTLSDGRTLAYSTAGPEDGFPVVVHHGTPGSRLFGEILTAEGLPGEGRFIIPDRPGYGRSSTPPENWGWERWKHDLTELVDAEGIDRAGIVGFSGGAPFAIATAQCAWATRLALVSPAIPPTNNLLSTLAEIPIALRVFFRVSKGLAAVTGSDSVVAQYTDRSVSESVANAVADDFHEGLRQGARAVSRESKLLATRSLDIDDVAIQVRCWHGTYDTNTPLDPAESFIQLVDGTLVTSETDHLGTLLDEQDSAVRWLTRDEGDVLRPVSRS